MKKFNNPYEYAEYINSLANKYKNLIEVVDIKNVQQIQNVDFSNQYSAWVNDYLGSNSLEKIEELYKQIIESDDLKLVIKTVENVFKKIYIVTNDIIEKREHQFHLKNINISEDILLNNYNVIGILKPDIFGSLKNDIFCINEFLDTQKEILKDYKEREIIDPLGYLEQQKEIDEYTEKVKNDEITISEMLKHFGYSFDDNDLNEDKIKKLVNDLVDEKITSEEFKEKVAAGEITLTEIAIIDAQLKLAYPEIYKKLNN